MLGTPALLSQDLSQFFTDTMNKALHMNKNDHVITVYLNLPRRFAFVEFRTPELAAAGLQLDGKQPKATNHSAVLRPPSPDNPAAAVCASGLPYNGMVLRVRRPNDFKPHLVPAPSEPPLPAMDLKSVGVLSNQVPDSKGKCFVGGIPYEMDEAQVRQLLESFGPLKALHLVRDPGSVTSKVCVLKATAAARGSLTHAREALGWLVGWFGGSGVWLLRVAR